MSVGWLQSILPVQVLPGAVMTQQWVQAFIAFLCRVAVQVVGTNSPAELGVHVQAAPSIISSCILALWTFTVVRFACDNVNMHPESGSMNCRVCLLFLTSQSQAELCKPLGKASWHPPPPYYNAIPTKVKLRKPLGTSCCKSSSCRPPVEQYVCVCVPV